MMFAQQLTVTKNTTSLTPVHMFMKLTRGVIHQIDVQFPPGCSDLVRVFLQREAHQIFPVTAGQTVGADTFVISGKMFQELNDHPLSVDVFAHNLDDTFDHTIEVRVWVLPKFAIMPAGAAEGLIQSLRSVFARREIR